MLLLLVHVPPAGGLLNVVADPMQSLRIPVIEPGSGLTVTTVVATQPGDSLYDIVEVPDDNPVTTPVVEPILARLGTLLLQVPPAVISLNVVLDPWQTVIKPVIAAGFGLTVTVSIAIQPVANE